MLEVTITDKINEQYPSFQNWDLARSSLRREKEEGKPEFNSSHFFQRILRRFNKLLPHPDKLKRAIHKLVAEGPNYEEKLLNNEILERLGLWIEQFSEKALSLSEKISRSKTTPKITTDEQWIELKTETGYLKLSRRTSIAREVISEDFLEEILESTFPDKFSSLTIHNSIKDYKLRNWLRMNYMKYKEDIAKYACCTLIDSRIH